MKQNTFIVRGMYVVLVLLVLIGGMLVQSYRMLPRPVSKPNNQYEILVYPDHYDLKDGSQPVGTIKVGDDTTLDILIERDNQ